VSGAEFRRSVAQVNLVFVSPAWGDKLRRRFRAQAVARANDPVDDVMRVAIRVHVHQLGGKVGIGRRTCSPEMDRDRTNHRERFGKGCTRINKDIVAQLNGRLINGRQTAAAYGIVATHCRNRITGIVDKRVAGSLR